MSPSFDFKVFRNPSLALAFAASVAGGCAFPPESQPSGASEKSDSGSGTPSLATMDTYQYLKIDAERSGIANVADDGRYTYVAFNQPVSEDTAFFDADGALVTTARSNRVVALPGIFKGLLVRTRQANSYIAPNPRASAADRPDLESDPDIVEARNRLEVSTTQMPAFQRAIQRSDATLRDLKQDRIDDALGQASGRAQPTPSSAADRNAAATYQRTSNGSIIRVFFSSGGRAIVRPDDGLRLLESEGLSAQEIRISGFTDAVGSERANAFLARQRAEAIRGLLISRGVPAQRIFVNWTANAQYLSDNDTESGRALNRRVEVVFVRDSGTRASR